MAGLAWIAAFTAAASCPLEAVSKVTPGGKFNGEPLGAWEETVGTVTEEAFRTDFGAKAAAVIEAAFEGASAVAVSTTVALTEGAAVTTAATKRGNSEAGTNAAAAVITCFAADAADGVPEPNPLIEAAMAAAAISEA
jgi:hypothetical protein